MYIIHGYTAKELKNLYPEEFDWAYSEWLADSVYALEPEMISKLMHNDFILFSNDNGIIYLDDGTTYLGHTWGEE